MDIALALGIANPDDLEHLPYRVYQEWFIYFRDGPLFWRILDQHFSRLESMFTAAWLKGHRRISDFQIYGPVRYTQPTGERLLKQVMILNQLYGGKVIDLRSGDDQD